MTSKKQRTAAKKNIKKAARAAKRARTIAHLPKKTRTALGKEGAKKPSLELDLSDEITRETLLTRDGEVVHARVKDALGAPVRA